MNLNPLRQNLLRIADELQASIKSAATVTYPDDFVGDDEDTEFGYSLFLEWLDDVMAERNPHKAPWHVVGKNMEWRHLSGEKAMHLEFGQDIIDKTFPKTNDFSVKVTETSTGMDMVISHHDAPTGEFRSFNVMSSIEQLEAAKDDVYPDLEHDIALLQDLYAYLDLDKVAQAVWDKLMDVAKSDTKDLVELRKEGGWGPLWLDEDINNMVGDVNYESPELFEE
jgi:hypothetical protein